MGPCVGSGFRVSSPSPPPAPTRAAIGLGFRSIADIASGCDAWECHVTFERVVLALDLDTLTLTALTGRDRGPPASYAAFGFDATLDRAILVEPTTGVHVADLTTGQVLQISR